MKSANASRGTHRISPLQSDCYCLATGTGEAERTLKRFLPRPGSWLDLHDLGLGPYLERASEFLLAYHRTELFSGRGKVFSGSPMVKHLGEDVGRMAARLDQVLAEDTRLLPSLRRWSISFVSLSHVDTNFSSSPPSPARAFHFLSISITSATTCKGAAPASVEVPTLRGRQPGPAYQNRHSRRRKPLPIPAPNFHPT